MACIDGGQQARCRAGSVGHADDPPETLGREEPRHFGRGVLFDPPFAKARTQVAADMQRVADV